MKLKLIACKSLFRELSYIASLSDNMVDITWIRQGYHSNPQELNKKLQEEIDSIETGLDSHTNGVLGLTEDYTNGSLNDFDYILLGYGLCSNGIIGLKATKYPLVIPRGHDCITFLLGSKEKYKECFNKMPGCFWYTPSWIESSCMPCKETKEKESEIYREMGYDDDTIEFLLESLHGWTKNYKTAAYIDSEICNNPKYKKFTKDAAEYFNWDYKCIDGNLSLLKNFIDGKWDEKDFLIVPVGYTVYATNDENIIGIKKIEE